MKYKLGEHLTELMSENGLDVAEFSKIINISESTIRDWKNNKYINLSNLLTLAKYFNCSLEFLVGRTDTPIDFAPHECPPFYERVRSVIKNCGKNINTIDRETNIKDSYFTKWKNGQDVHILSLIELADYLGVTLDYLVGREQ